MNYLLDTDTSIWVLREKEPVLSRFQSCSPAEVAVTSMTEAELRYGALKSSDPADAFVRLETFLAAVAASLPFDSEAARRHADVRYALRAQQIGERDLVIASTALAHGGVLITHNTREFRRVPGLSVEDWTRGA